MRLPVIEAKKFRHTVFADRHLTRMEAIMREDFPVGFEPIGTEVRRCYGVTACGVTKLGVSLVEPDVIGEVLGCGSTTVERYQEELEPLVDVVLTPLYERVRDQARRDAVLVDGLVAPVGERDDVDGLFSEKKGFCGQNVQVVANLAGRVVDVGDPCPGGMHDRRAFDVSGIAARWAGHHAPGGPGMIGDKGYQGAGIVSPYKKPRGRELTEVRRACNTALNRIRAAVERAVAHLKCWKVFGRPVHHAVCDQRVSAC
ncbi:transposase family protein [Micromonospora sp. LOL_023]|uniref:transposase family protein n=1 Tax=Micromonospora sp. LOL_023 TaxID=3345418 RepID=UPI003A8A6217